MSHKLKDSVQESIDPFDKERIKKKIYYCLEKVEDKKEVFFNPDGSINKEKPYIHAGFNIMMPTKTSYIDIQNYIEATIAAWCDKKGFFAFVGVEINHRTNYSYRHDKMLQLVSELKFVLNKSKELLLFKTKYTVITGCTIRIANKGVIAFEQEKLQEIVPDGMKNKTTKML